MSEKLADSSEYRHGNMVFFDLLGVVVVAYPARVGTILNYMVATATFIYLAKKASLPGNGGGSSFPLVDSCHVMLFPVLGVSGMFSSLWIILFFFFFYVAFYWQPEDLHKTMGPFHTNSPRPSQFMS